MSYLKCSKHGTDLECMGGCSAHRDNWYCPKCDEEAAIREEYEAARKKEDGDLLFDPDPVLSKENMKEIKNLYEEKLINAYCANVMGYHERPGNNDEPLYYDEEGFYICRVKDYTPYGDLIPLKVVANIITDQTGLSPDNDIVSKDGMLSAYRAFLLGTIMTEDDIKELEDEEAETVDEERDFESMGGDPTNINWQAGRILVLANYRGFASFYSGCTDEYFLSKEPNSSNHIESIEIDSFNANGLSQSNAIEGYIRDPANGLGLWETVVSEIDTMVEGFLTTSTAQAQRIRIIRKCLEMMAAEHMSDEDKFNERCQRLIKAYGEPGLYVDGYNPYDNMDSLVEVVDIIINTTHINFLVVSGSGITFTEEMRAYVKWYGSEEYINLD